MFNYIETYTIITRVFIYLKIKNVYFSSFIETGLSGCIVWHWSTESSNLIAGVSDSLESFRLISVKQIIKILDSRNSDSYVININRFRKNLIVTFTFTNWIMINLPVLLIILKVSINLEKWLFLEHFFAASN